jgi:toxin ParE1/3/4
VNQEPRWVPEAVEDLRRARDWYDEREPGLGGHLATEAFRALDYALGFPKTARRYEWEGSPREPVVRKVPLKRFDEYSLLYAVVDDIVWVVALAHVKRKPAFWAGRVVRLPGGQSGEAAGGDPV